VDAAAKLAVTANAASAKIFDDPQAHWYAGMKGGAAAGDA